MKKTGWDSYLKEQKRNPRFRRAFEEESRALRVGAALAHERSRRGLSQEAVAAKMGTSAPQLSRTERLPEHANLKTLLRYAEVLGMNLDFVLRPKKSANRGKAASE
jgi:ribosome-binding protein aMBF1 (putative translation factor)